MVYKTKLLLFVLIIGTFSQRPSDHLKGDGCPQCGMLLKYQCLPKSHNQFITDANLIHNNKYSYPNKYVKAHTLININCSTHGIFTMKPNSHLNGQGCPACVLQSKGWSFEDWHDNGLNSSYFESFKVYVIWCFNEREQFIKVGKTYRNIKTRFKSKFEMPYNYEVIKTFEFNNGIECCEFEALLHKKYLDFTYKPLIEFGGKTECFSINAMEIK